MIQHKLHPVKLKKFDNCYTYILKRRGIFDQFHDMESTEFAHKFKGRLIESTEDLVIGDILVYFHEDPENFKGGFEIDDKGEVLFYKKIIHDLHFVIIESKCHYSHITYLKGYKQIEISSDLDDLFDNNPFLIEIN